MGRHRTAEEKARFREQARGLRAEGVPRREIVRQLGISDELLGELLRGTTVPDSLRRPRALDAKRVRAVELRRDGYSIPAIAERLGVARSTAWLWVGGTPLQRERLHRAPLSEASRERRREIKALDRERDWAAGAAALASSARRDVLLAGAVSYWCEGGKSKPWRTDERLVFINSDPGLLRLFCALLDELRADEGRWSFRLSIHEGADVDAAQAQWRQLLERPGVSRHRPTLKRHNPSSRRRNTGDHYRGCVVVTVRRSVLEYRLIEGIVRQLFGQVVAPSAAPRDALTSAVPTLTARDPSAVG